MFIKGKVSHRKSIFIFLLYVNIFLGAGPWNILENVTELYILSEYLQHQKKLVGMTVKQKTSKNYSITKAEMNV